MTARILIVEDENIAAELLCELLQAMGHSVCGITAYGEEALAKAVETKPGLVLMDINLRGRMNGIEAAVGIRDLLDIPIVYLTAHTDPETVQQAKMTTPFAYIEKPYRIGELRTAIEIALYRHTMERRLKEREASYRLLADNLPGILYRLSLADNTTQFFNDMLVPITGFSEDELAAEKITLERLMLPEDRKVVKARVEAAVAIKAPFEVEYRIRHRDGDIRHLIDYGRPIVADDGTPREIDGMIFDITERKRVENELKEASKALEERKTFFESIISNNETGILVTDLNLRVLLANPYIQEICDKRGEEIVGRHLGEFFPEICERIVAGIDADEIAIKPSKQERVIGFSRFNLKGVNRAVVGHIINLKDLREIVKIRAEMRQKERLSTMGEVVGRVAHEMRNPLFGMTAVGQILDMELDLEPAHKELIDSFLKEARRLNNLVEELLDSTKELRLRKKSVNLLKILDASLAVSQALAKARDVSIGLSLPEGELMLAADPEKIEQVLLNLLKNAIEASPDGGAVQLSVQDDGDSAGVRVTDQGYGIPEESLDKIFDVFYTTKKCGTGMGLSISKNIVDAHGGTLTAQNNSAGGGATFMMILPMARRRT